MAWMGFQKGLTAFKGTARSATGKYSGAGDDTGISHVGAGSFDGLFHEPDPLLVPPGAGNGDTSLTSYNPAAVLLDRLPVGSGSE